MVLVPMLMFGATMTEFVAVRVCQTPQFGEIGVQDVVREDVIGQIALRVLDGDHGLGAGIGDSDGEPEVRVVRIICRVGAPAM